MPRQAHGRSLLASGPSKPKQRKSAKGRGLNALETAEREFPEQIKIRQHRLGVAEEDDNAPNSRQDADERSAKRRKIDNSVDAPSDDEGSDPDGNPWHVGVEEDDEDSDIDSDEAFGESDEERFADFTFRGSENPKNKSAQISKRERRGKSVDLDEENDGLSDASEAENEDYEDDLGEDAIDLATAWDMDDEEQRKEQEKAATKRKGSQRTSPPPPQGSTSEMTAESGSEEESGGSENDFENFSVSEDDESEETTARLRSFVNGLIPDEQPVAKRDANSVTRNLPDKPSQFALGAAGISAADLMQYVNDPIQRQSLKILQAAEREDGSHTKGNIPGKLAVPLAKRQQDRLDRVAAYDQTKQTLDRWVDTVKQNRRAEHVSFPLADPSKASASSVKSLQPMSRAQPQSALEIKIRDIMLESGFSSARGNDNEVQEQEYEELKAKQIPLEELQARRKELRMQRELMFREEVRAKRIKKIKSKAYRRVHRKEKDKFAVQERDRLLAAGLLNSDEERERNDRRRAEERMGARHRESKWAKAARATGQTTWNEDAKMGVSELARRDEELRRRVEGKDVRGSDASSASSESEYSDTDDEDEKWNQKLEKLDEPPAITGKSKLADMAFMKRAEAERKAQNDKELRLLRQSMNGGEDDSSASGSDGNQVSGRQKFGGRNDELPRPFIPQVMCNEFEERLSGDELEDQLARQTSPKPVAKQQKTSMNGFSPVAKVAHASKSDIPPPKQTSTAGKKSKTAASLQKTAQSTLNDYTSPSESEPEQGDVLDDKDKLALDIFAGDDAEDLRKQFQKEKKQTVRDEGDQIIDNMLPGWGSWTGAGISKKEQKRAKGRFVTTIKGVAAEARKDAKLDNVIVNEKRVKKNGKYLATELPHPFESRQQYERSLRLPMGPEWSTRNHFQDAIKPRVLLKQGQTVNPIARPRA